MDTTIQGFLEKDSPTAVIPNAALGRDIRIDAELVEGFHGFLVDGTEIAAMHRWDDESDEQYERRCFSVRAAIAKTVEHVGLMQ
jgi:hypothetical protein